MGKLNMYLMAMCVWILLFNFAGLLDGGSSYLLNNVGILHPENLGSSQFYTTIVAIFAVTIAGVAIGATVFRDASIILLIKNVAIGELLVVLLWDLLALYRVMIITNRYIALLIFTPLMLVYLLTLAEWVRGMQT